MPQEFEKIRLGFDEQYLEQQLSRASANFEDFASGVRQKIDRDVFSDDALRRMYVASERLKEIMDKMKEVEALKSQSNANDEVYLKRIETQRAHLAAMATHEATELERTRRGSPAAGQPNQPGVLSPSAQGIGMGVLAGTGSLADAATGVNLSGIASSAAGLFSAYRGKKDDVTGERVRDEDEIKQQAMHLASNILYAGLSLGLKGYETEKHTDRARQAMFQGGMGGQMSTLDAMDDDAIIERTGLSRLEYYQRMGQYNRSSGGNLDSLSRNMPAYNDIFSMERAYGGESASGMAGLMGAADKRGQSGVGNDIGTVLGLALAEGLNKARLPELIQALTMTVSRGYSDFDLLQEARVEASIAKAGGPGFEGARAAQINATAQSGLGRSGFGMSLLMKSKENGGLGMNYFDAQMAAENPNTWNTPEARKALRQSLSNMPPELRRFYIAQFTGLSQHEADAYAKSLFADEESVSGKAGYNALDQDEEGAAKYDQLERVPKHFDAKIALPLGRAAANLVRGGADPLEVIKSMLTQTATGAWRSVKEALGGGGSNQGFNGATFSNPNMASSLESIQHDFEQETGEKFKLPGSRSGDRTEADRAKIWDETLKKYGGNKEEARKHAAEFHSQHQEGRAVDLPENVRKWLAKNDPTGDKYSLEHPKRLGDKDLPHYELKGGSSVNRTGAPIRITTTTIVEPTSDATTAADRHADDAQRNYKDSRDVVSLTGPGRPSPLGGGR